MSAVPGGDSVPGPCSIGRADWRGSGQVSTCTGLAGLQRPAYSAVVCRAMLVLQEAHSGFHRAGRPLVRVGDQGDRFRMDGTKERGIRAVEERPDQCADTRVYPRRGAVVP